MFKKKPTIKTLAPLRSSDRRRIADQIIQEYSVEVPSAPREESEQQENESSAPSLASIRNSLLPENTQAGRFTTTHGPNLDTVHGTIYVGTHPGCEERALWFRLEQGPGTDGRLYPTVYTLWHNPGLAPLLLTPDFVMGKLYGGADLMTPGLANGPPFPQKAIKGAVVAVAGLDKPSVPTFVGVCEIDVASLGEVQGMKGHAVRGVQWEGDELWAWSVNGRPGQKSPDHLDGWLDEVHDIGEALDELELEEEGNGSDQEAPGGVSLGEAGEDEQEPEPEVDEKEPTTKEIDEAFDKAFVYALYQHKKDNPSQPNHGLSFPIQPSYVVSNLITPYLPIHTPKQAQFYQIKKTSYKNVKKFIKHLDKIQLVKSKDRGGESIILDVDFDDHLVNEFVPYRLPKKTGSESAGKSKGKAPAVATGDDPALGQSLNVKTLYKPSGKLTPDLFPPLSNNDPKNYYNAKDIQKRLADYLTSQELISPSNPRVISLNPFISNKILTSNSPADQGALARGTILRDVLVRRIIEDSSLCAPYHALIKPGQKLEDVKPKPGALPKITVTLERRTGNKVVTRVMGLETFGVVPQMMAEELQKKCASSTSVTQATGAAKGLMEVLVQGDHRRVVDAVLNKRGVKSQWVDVVDKTQKKGR